MKKLVAYTIGLIFTLFMTLSSMTIGAIEQQYDHESGQSYLQSVDASLMARAQMEHARSTLFLCESLGSGITPYEQTRVPVRVVKIGVSLQIIRQAMYMMPCGSVDHGVRLVDGHQQVRNSIDYYIYTLRKIII